MKSQNLKTNVHDVRTGVLQSGFAEEGGKKGPSFAEIRQRAREIHIERGGHVCDMDNYLDEWLQAEHELQKKYINSSCG